MYQPGAIVVCGGADSLSGDRLGCFNLSLDGHAHCMDFLARFGVPMLVLGGGGYTMRNVARCWAYETGRLLGQELPDECAPGAPRARPFRALRGRSACGAAPQPALEAAAVFLMTLQGRMQGCCLEAKANECTQRRLAEGRYEATWPARERTQSGQGPSGARWGRNARRCASLLGSAPRSFVFGGGRLPMEALSEYDFYMDTHRLRISVSNMKNANTRDKLEAIRVSVLSNLSKLPAAPSAPLAPRPPSNFRVRARVAAPGAPRARRLQHAVKLARCGDNTWW